MPPPASYVVSPVPFLREVLVDCHFVTFFVTPALTLTVGRSSSVVITTDDREVAFSNSSGEASKLEQVRLPHIACVYVRGIKISHTGGKSNV